LAWDYLNDPTCRALYRGYDDLPLSNMKQDRIGVDTVYHCAHGDRQTPETITDWKPFGYVTFRGSSKIVNFTLFIDFTVSLKPIASGTHVSVNYSRPGGEPPTLVSKFVVPLFGIGLKFSLRSAGEVWAQSINERIERDQDAGNIQIKPAPA
jgi:hypothetical protein